MATLKTIRKRIASVRNTQKITKAMKMVAAAKLRRAQQRVVQARPYSMRVEEMLQYVAALSPLHPLLQERENPTRAEYLILTSDRGLCGGFNGNLLRRIEEQIRQPDLNYTETRLHVIGKKGRDFFKSRSRDLASCETGLYEKFEFGQAEKMADDFIRGYLEEKFDHLYLVYNYFKSAISQEVRIERILPVRRQSLSDYLPEYLYEPDRDTILETLIRKSLGTLVYRAFLESMASELGARMSAMESATNNCSDFIYRLTLQLNRARQASITKELMDIVNGAEALK
ncbi:MAG: ATP synthase F1 subunit gamma [Deltaproteobacteria bacterium]|nr:ATP synthase F1 subunit gamma [Deltaproteobacteria bacterium]